MSNACPCSFPVVYDEKGCVDHFIVVIVKLNAEGDVFRVTHYRRYFSLLVIVLPFNTTLCIKEEESTNQPPPSLIATTVGSITLSILEIVDEDRYIQQITIIVLEVQLIEDVLLRRMIVGIG